MDLICKNLINTHMQNNIEVTMYLLLVITRGHRTHILRNPRSYYVIRLGQIPAAYLKRNIKETTFTMRYYGLGPVGTKAMTKSFQV